MKSTYFSYILGLVLLASCGSDEMPTVTPDPPVTPDPVEETSIIPKDGYETPLTYDGMDLVWADEFDGPTINADNWTFELGTGQDGWGNQEAQYYREENARIEEGNLIIEAKREVFSSRQFTSSRMITLGKQEFQYGRIDVRAALPKGSGMWPAIWTLGANFPDVGWPRCGEIDLMEMFGADGNQKVLGTVHWDNLGQYANFGGSQTLRAGNFSDFYHVFSIIWDEELIRWYVDDVQFHAIDITPAELDEFRAPHFLILNVAVGGDKGAGEPTGTSFPQRMAVDYVRVFQPS